MTKIEVHYVDGDGIVYPAKDSYPIAEKYYIQDGTIQFTTIAAHTLIESEIIIPFNNVVSIKIWKEGDEVNESKDS